MSATTDKTTLEELNDIAKEKQNKLQYYKESSSMAQISSVDNIGMLAQSAIIIQSNGGQFDINGSEVINLSAPSAHYNGYEIATVKDLETKQDKLEYYSEDATYGDVTIKPDRNLSLSTPNGGIGLSASIGSTIIYGNQAYLQSNELTYISADNSNTSVSLGQSFVEIKTNGAATYNGKEIATVDDVDTKQDKLKYYSESDTQVRINNSANDASLIVQENSSYLSSNDTTYIKLDSKNLDIEASDGEATYAGNEIATVENVVIGGKELSKIGFKGKNLCDDAFEDWELYNCGSLGINIQDISTYEIFNSGSDSTATYTLSLSSSDYVTLRSSWFTLSFFTVTDAASTLGSLSLKATISNRENVCYVDNKYQNVSSGNEITIPLEKEGSYFHTISFKANTGSLITPTIEIKIIFPSTRVYVGLPKLEVGKIATLAYDNTSEFYSDINTIRDQYPSSTLLSLSSYWFTNGSFDSIEIVDCAPVSALGSYSYTVRLRCVFHTSTNSLGIIRQNSTTAALISDYHSGSNYYFFYDILVPYIDDKLTELDYKYTISY